MTPTRAVATVLAVAVILVVSATGAAILPGAVTPLVLVAVRTVVLPEGAAAATEAGVPVWAAAGV